ncbi:MAG: PAS domain-containing protein, partial [Chitinophagaceae bacterium]
MSKPRIFNNADELVDTYKVVFETNPIPHLLLLPDAPKFTIVAANEAYLKSTGTSKSEIIRKGLFEIFPIRYYNDPALPEDQLMASLNKILREKIPDQLEFHEYDLNIAGPGGDVGQYWNLVNRPVINNEGEVVYIIHAVTDETAVILNKKNEQREKLNDQVQEQINYNLFRQAPVAIAILQGPDFKVELANIPMLKLWGRTQEQILGKPIFETLPETVGEGIAELMKEVRETGVPYIGVEIPTLIERNGILETVYFNLIYQPLRQRDGNFDKIMVITTEVLEQASAKKDLQKSKEYLNLALEFGNIGVWQFEYATNVINHSETVSKLLGYPAHLEWNREKLLELIYDEDRQHVVDCLSGVLVSGIIAIDFRIKKGNDSFAWLNVQGKTMFDGKNAPIRMLGLVSDITSRKDDELRKDEFMGIVSHELKTPVTSLKAYGQILHEKFLQENNVTSADMLGKMDSQVNKLASLIEDLLDATRIEGGQLRFHEAEFNVNEMVSEIIEEVQRTTKNQKIIMELAEDTKLYGDRDRIGQVLTNLLTNAIKYSPGKKDIIVRTKISAESFTCSVADEGLGIPKENLLKIFERYYRILGNRRQTYPGL